MIDNAETGLLDEAFMALLFRALASHAASYISAIDRQRRILFLNRTRSRRLDEVVGKPMEDFVAPAQRQETIHNIERAFETNERQAFAFQATLADGTHRYLVTEILPLKSPSGAQAALVLTEDHTEKRQLSEDLQASVEFRRIVLENIPDFVGLVDRDQRIVWVNKVAPNLKLEDVVGLKVEAFTSPETVPQVRAAITRSFELGTIEHFEVERRRPDGSTGWYASRVVPTGSKDAPKNALVITADVTERKRAEKELRDTQEQLHLALRLESLRQLAGGVAHDFNNLLQVLQSTLYFAQQGLAQGRPVAEELGQAMRAVERATELTSHLLAIGRRTPVASKSVDLGALVQHTIRMLRRAIPENVRLSCDVPEGKFFVALDASQFEQVLINLCVNARDAMPEGGTLTVGIEAEGPASLALHVSDTGVGIGADDLTHVFEPFFTTKGAGSGLGLPVAAGIVAAHGGAIVARSEKGKGTTMSVRLPVAEPADEETAAGPSPQQLSGTEVILVAEDEALVREQAVRVLEAHGYTVIQAADGASAIEQFREHRGKVDLVVLDVIMPGMNGWQAFLEMEKIDPSVKALFATGYAADALPGDLTRQRASVMRKPYKPPSLLARVREALDRSTVK